jgi:hypothetical protein
LIKNHKPFEALGDLGCRLVFGEGLGDGLGDSLGEGGPMTAAPGGCIRFMIDGEGEGLEAGGRVLHGDAFGERPPRSPLVSRGGVL